MSPEQCSQSGALDARSDIYSLGIIVYEMLAGRVPFTGESATAIMMKQVQDQPPSILSAHSNVPPAVDAVIKRALAKQPIDRFQSAGELSAAFGRAAGGEGALEPQIDAAVTAPQTAPNASVRARLDDAGEMALVRPRNEGTQVPPQQG